MKKRIHYAICVAALIGGWFIADGINAANAAPAPAIEIQEDDPAWSCYDDGNKICGPTDADGLEAWSRFDPLAFPEEVLSKPFSVTYRGTALEGIDFPSSGYYTLSSSVAGKVHVFEIGG